MSNVTLNAKILVIDISNGGILKYSALGAKPS